MASRAGVPCASSGAWPICRLPSGETGAVHLGLSLRAIVRRSSLSLLASNLPPTAVSSSLKMPLPPTDQVISFRDDLRAEQRLVETECGLRRDDLQQREA